MSKYNNTLGVSFNDNSGVIGSFCHSSGAYDVNRLYEKHGKIKARLILLKHCWRAILRAEDCFLGREKTK